ncbi:hypothetical protein A2U01_0110988, partial [Trifolium medium]|nr:hypothetical protein [Trifolium medium]
MSLNKQAQREAIAKISMKCLVKSNTAVLLKEARRAFAE